MSIMKQKLDGLRAQLAMALSSNTPSKMQIALLKAEIKKLEEITCRKCGGEMKPGKAIEQTYTGTPDFVGDAHPVTVSPGGKGRLIDCKKCERCGWSTTK